MDNEITLTEALALLNTSKAILIDVRTKEEITAVKAPCNFVSIPLQELELRFNEIPKDKRVLALCHHGHRSLLATKFLKSKDFSCSSIKGGINEWANCDSTIKKYLRTSFGIVIEKEKV